jgi:hypothetical protein
MLENIDNDNFKQIENYKYTSVKLLQPINNYEELTDYYFNDDENYDDLYGIYLK